MCVDYCFNLKPLSTTSGFWRQWKLKILLQKRTLFSTYGIKTQVPEQCLHEDLGQVGVRVACYGIICRVCQGCKSRSRWEHLRAISGWAVSQKRSHMGVVLQAGQDDVQLHPLWDTHKCDYHVLSNIYSWWLVHNKCKNNFWSFSNPWKTNLLNMTRSYLFYFL